MNETLNIMGMPMHVKSNGEAAMFVADHPVPPGHFVPPHRHDSDDELLLIIEGELTLIDDSGEHQAGPGTCATFTRGMLHGYRNDTAGTARMIVVATPGVQAAEMFRHFDRAGRNGLLSPDDVATIAAQYGVSFG
jgi:uncharacterized cupin superfamily protein